MGPDRNERSNPQCLAQSWIGMLHQASGLFGDIEARGEEVRSSGRGIVEKAGVEKNLLDSFEKTAKSQVVLLTHHT